MTSVMRPNPRYELALASQVPHTQTELPDTSAVAVTRIQICSVLFVVVVHTGNDKDSLMRRRLCGKLHGRHRSCCSHCSSHRSDSQIFVENCNFCLPHLHSTHPLGGPRRNIATTFDTEKLNCVKKINIMFVRFDRVHERDRRTDGHTDTAWRHRPRLHSIAQKNQSIDHNTIDFLSVYSCNKV